MSKFFLSFVYFGMINLFACSSDFDCDFGQSCIKKVYNFDGVCVNNVNEYGVQ